MSTGPRVSVGYEVLDGWKGLAITFHGVSWEDVVWVDYLLQALGAGGIAVLVDTREPPEGTSMVVDSESNDEEHVTFRMKVWLGA